MAGPCRKYLDNLLDGAPTKETSPDRLLRGLARLAEELGSAGSLERQEALDVLDSTAQTSDAQRCTTQQLLSRHPGHQRHRRVQQADQLP